MFTRSEYCHVGIAWCVAGRVFVLEAVGSGVRIFPLSLALPFFLFRLYAPLTRDAEKWALAQVGKPYSKWQAILAGLGLLKAGDDSVWQCAEYAQEVLKRTGVDLPGDPTPSNIVRQAQERGAPAVYITAGGPSRGWPGDGA